MNNRRKSHRHITVEFEQRHYDRVIAFRDKYNLNLSAFVRKAVDSFMVTYGQETKATPQKEYRYD